MATKYDRIPRLNDLRFIVGNDQLPVQYSTWPFDRGFFEEKIREYQRYIPYKQKRNSTDYITVYLDTIGTNVIVHILNDDGEILNSLDFGGIPSAVESGNTAPNDDVYNTYTLMMLVSDYFAMNAVEVDKDFYVVIECVYPSGGNTYYSSEPIHVKRGRGHKTIRGGRKNMAPYDRALDYAGHVGTQLIEARHTENDYDVLFGTIPNLVFRQRIESSIEYKNPTSNDTIFEDQGYRMRTLQSVPGDLYNFRIGGNQGISDYEWDKVNRLLSLSNLRIDFTRYTKPEGAKWNDNSEPNYPFKHANIDLVEYEPGSGTTTSVGGDILLFATPTGDDGLIFPCALNFLNITDFESVELSGAYVFEDEDDIDAFVDYLNLTVIPAEGLGGSAYRDANKVYYRNALGENYTLGPGSYMCYKYMQFILTTGTTVGAGQFRFNMHAFAGGYAQMVVDWGDGSVDWLTSSGDIFAPFDHTYTQTGSPIAYAIRFFHRGPDTDGFSWVEGFSFASPLAGREPRVTGISSGTNIEAPPYLKKFIMANQNLVGPPPSLNTTFLAVAAATLTDVWFIACNIGGSIATFAPMLFDYPGDPMFPNLIRVYIVGNKLTSTLVDNLCNSLYDHTTLSLTDIMHIYMHANTPAAPPTAASNIARTAWNVFGYDMAFDT